jgi:Icc-related predicted phosphoesterase
MNIQIISDIHNEKGFNEVMLKSADMLVIAGDLNETIKGVDWLLENIKEIPVVYVLGNHEYFGGAYPKTLNEIKAKAEGTNIHVLENDVFEYGGVIFHGCSLWTDYALFGEVESNKKYCEGMSGDYKHIQNSDTRQLITANDFEKIHQTSKEWLRKSLLAHKGKTNIVVTHHAPSIQSILEEKKQNPISTAYASNLESFIEETQPAFWFHGHIHKNFDYQIEQTRIMTNPHGYKHKRNNEYVEEMVIEL